MIIGAISRTHNQCKQFTLFTRFVFTGSTALALHLFHDHFTDGETPWRSDQLVARPLPKHWTTQTQNKHIHIPNTDALFGIRTRDPGFQASEDSTCLRPLGYRERPLLHYLLIFTEVMQRLMGVKVKLSLCLPN
jgi:hypothetical protein